MLGHDCAVGPGCCLAICAVCYHHGTCAGSPAPGLGKDPGAWRKPTGRRTPAGDGGSALTASFTGLVTTPHRYSQNWTQEMDMTLPSVPRPLLSRIMSGQPHVQGYAAGIYWPVQVNARDVPVAAQPAACR
jgi:hypothetical protein